MYDAKRHICFNLGKVMRQVYNYYEQKLSPLGLTPSQFFVFNALWMQDGINFSELEEQVSLDASTLTGIIDRMERNGFVERRQDLQDRRAVRVFLTPKAKEMGHQILKFADELDADLRRPFSEAEIRTFERVLTTLAERIW